MRILAYTRSTQVTDKKLKTGVLDTFSLYFSLFFRTTNQKMAGSSTEQLKIQTNCYRPASSDELRADLDRFGIDSSKLNGKAGSKTVDALHGEIVDNESDISLLRTVSVLNLFIRHSDRLLFEQKQYFHQTQQERKRDLPVAEKLKSGEENDLNAVIQRAIHEELNLAPNEYVMGSFIKDPKTITSFQMAASYPGLMTQYKKIYVGLSLVINDNERANKFFSDFAHTETKDGAPRLTTYWHWVPIRDLLNAEPCGQSQIEIKQVIKEFFC